jgi:uncharacterized membrane-anchored protein
MEIMSVFLVFGIVIVVFLLFREVNLWYFKINESIELQKETVRLLKVISGENNNDDTKSNSKSDTTETVFRETKDNKFLKIISVNNASIGAEVYINDEIAPDGIYEYLNDSRKIVVKRGRIIELIK